MSEPRSIGTGVVGFILGVLACLVVAFYAGGSADEAELRRLREENRVLRELTDVQRQQLEEIEAVMEQPSATEWEATVEPAGD